MVDRVSSSLAGNIRNVEITCTPVNYPSFIDLLNGLGRTRPAHSSLIDDGQSQP